MTIRRLLITLLLMSMAVAACAPRPATATPDLMSTTVAELAASFLTRTAAAASPTPATTATPPPPASPAASLPAVAPAGNATPTPVHQRPLIKSFTGCYFGPGPSYTLESNIKAGARVELLGVGSETGWYIIRNPYFHKPCWVAASELEIDPGINLAALRVMTPGAP